MDGKKLTFSTQALLYPLEVTARLSITWPSLAHALLRDTRNLACIAWAPEVKVLFTPRYYNAKVNAYKPSFFSRASSFCVSSVNGSETCTVETSFLPASGKCHLETMYAWNFILLHGDSWIIFYPTPGCWCKMATFSYSWSKLIVCWKAINGLGIMNTLLWYY